MAYQAAPYSDLDYLTAILMGESGARDDARAMGALADVVMNRVNGTQSPRTAYGDSFTYNPNSVAGQVTATFRGAPQFSSADRAQAQREGTGAAYDNYNNALTRGAEAFSGAARDRYNQARAVASSFLDQSDPNYGRYSGVSGGADFFVARGYPTYLRGGRYDSQTIGGSDFFKLKSNGGFTPWNDPGDRGVMNALPPAGSDLTGDGFDASQGAGSVGPGGFGMGTGVIETGDPFAFGGANVSSGVGLGFNNLGGATPFGNVTPFAFAGDRNFAGGVGPGPLNPSLTPYDPAPDAYAFAGGFNPSQGVGPGSLAPSGLTSTPLTDTASTIGAPAASGGLPSFFSPIDYINANADLAGMSNQQAIEHYLNYGQYETRALAPWLQASAHSAPGGTSTIGAPGLSSTLGPSTTTTLGSGSTASTIGAPSAVNGLPPGFSEQAYMIANPDVAASGQSAADHFLRWGQYDVRALAPGEEARVHAAPGSISPYGGTVQASTYQPPQPTQTLGPDGSVNVMSSGLVPTLTPPDLTSTIGPGPTITARTGTFNPDEYLRANADVAASGQSALDHFRNYGAREGRAIDTLGNHFNGEAYLAQNRDVALAGLNPLEHFLRYGAQEARTLAPTDWASPLTATTDVGTYGAPAATQTLGPSGFTPTIDAPPLTSTIGPPSLSGTYGPPAATSTLAPPMAMPSYSPGGGINNPFGFSNANVGSGLGATSQSFSSFYPLDTNIGYSSGGSSGGGGAISDPFAFSGADVSGFDVNAAPPADSGGQGGGGGGGGGTAKGSSSSAAFLADQARTRAYWESLAKPADLYGNTNTHTTPVVGAPVVPNLTLGNLAMGAPGAMFSMFAPWR